MAAAAHLRRLRETLDGPITLGALAARMGRDGIGLVVFIAALPFLQPIPLAGLGTPVGLLLIALGLQLARGHAAPALPRFVAEHRLEKTTVDRLLSAAERLLGTVEKFARPRWSFATRAPRTYGVAIILCGLISAVPVFVPFGNPITATPLALMALAILEDDGLLGAVGLAGTALTLAYHAAFLVLMWKGAHALVGGRP